MTDIKDFAEKLKNEGILFKGFGIVSKFAMQDTELPLESKAICACIASYAGNKNSAFPSQKTIRDHLQLSKKGFKPHFKQLINHGYITVTKKPFSNNVYKFVPFPDKFRNYAQQNGKDYTHIKEYGYGMIPKAVMTDPRLDVKAKGLYAYWASLGGAEKIAVRSQSEILRHLNVCEKTYYTYYNQLLDLNYIIAEPPHTETNAGSTNRYHLIQNPDTANARKPLPTDISKKDTRKKEPLSEDTPNKEPININPRNKNKITNKNNNSISSEPLPAPTSTAVLTSLDDEIQNIKSIINYDQQILLYPNSKDDIDKSITFIAETLVNDNDSLFAPKSSIPKDAFRNTIRNLSFAHITDVLTRISNAGRKINNAKKYILTSIYNQVVNSKANDQNHCGSYYDSVRIEYKTFELSDFFAKAIKAGMRYDK